MSNRNHVVVSISTLVLAVALISAIPAAPVPSDAAEQAMATISANAIRADMRFLSDDLLEGRGTATRGHELAAKFIATRLEGLGLQPAGDNGTWYQEVPLRRVKTDEAKSSFTVIHGGKAEALTFRKDYIVAGDPTRTDVSVEAPVVFVAYGVTAPDQNYDDYKQIDANGKIVAMLASAPKFQSAVRAHYSSPETKAGNAVAHGAVGIILIDDPIFEQVYSFDKRVRDLVFPGYRWLDKQGRPNDHFPKLKGVAELSLDATKKFFAGSAHTAEQIFAADKEGKLPAFAMPITARIHTVSQLSDAHSPNVIGKLEGTDPALKSEYLLYTAHLDHVGIGEPVDGDKVYNGALDNASGSATLLELARAFSKMNPRPRRSILFALVTGEEAGLLGSDYMAHYPTVPKNSIVANLNVDEVLMLWPMEDVIAFGAEHSSLDNVIKKAAERVGVTESPDPMPDEVIFIRSDQYSFVRQGIPSVMPTPGFKSNDPKINPQEIFGKWEETRYHQPQDEIDQPNLNFDSAAKFARFAFLCGYMITEDQHRPAWNKGDFFGDHYSANAK
jgi:Peptidase family M28/PA domain